MKERGRRGGQRDTIWEGLHLPLILLTMEERGREPRNVSGWPLEAGKDKEMDSALKSLGRNVGEGTLMLAHCLACLSSLSLPSMAATNACVYPSFSQPHCFLSLVCFRGASAVAEFEEDRRNPQVNCSLITLTIHVPPALSSWSRLSVPRHHSHPLLFCSLSFNVWPCFVSQHPSPILGPDWFHRSDDQYLSYIQGYPQSQSSRDAPNISNGNSTYFPTAAIFRMCFGEL